MVAAMLLADCGGGGGMDAYGACVSEAPDLGRERETCDWVLPEDVPTTGRATYTGTYGFGAGLGISTSRQMYGSIDLVVDFGGESVTGRVYGIVSNGSTFTDEGEGPVQGELVLSNGVVVREPLPDPRFNPYILADVTGTLVEPEPIGTNTYDLQLEAAVFGPNAEMIAGDIFGTSEADMPFGVVSGTMVARTIGSGFA